MDHVVHDGVNDVDFGQLGAVFDLFLGRASDELIGNAQHCGDVGLNPVLSQSGSRPGHETHALGRRDPEPVLFHDKPAPRPDVVNKV